MIDGGFAIPAPCIQRQPTPGTIMTDVNNNELVLLNKEHLAPSPIEQFCLWFDQAKTLNYKEPNAMTLATVDAKQRPSSRIVLLKQFDANGFIFFTNYDSDKAQDLAANPYASLCFWWEPLYRQIRIDGRVEKTSPDISDSYFASRPRESNLSAHASMQSRPIASKQALIEQRDAIKQKFAGKDTLPRPDNWGGYILIPDKIEFWQGCPARFHDRFVYTVDKNGEWIIQRLAP